MPRSAFFGNHDRKLVLVVWKAESLGFSDSQFSSIFGFEPFLVTQVQEHHAPGCWYKRFVALRGAHVGLRRPNFSIAPIILSKQGSVDRMDDLFVLRRAGISRHRVRTTVVNALSAGTSGKH